MHPSLPRPAGVLAALALLAASTHLSAQKALVLCPPADASGCERVAQVLAGMEGAGGGPLFPEGIDGRFEDLRTATPAEMHAYSLVFVPSFANAPYDLLREAPVRERLGRILTGRVAVWSGTPDRGTTAGKSAGKLELIRNLARWAAAGDAPGLVVLQDFSDPRVDGTSRRYDWIRGVAGIEVAAAPVMRTYRGVKVAEGGGAREIVGDLAYENMASFGLAARADPAAIRALGLEGPGRPTTEDAVVLLAWDRKPSGSVAALSVSSPVIDILPTTISYNVTSLVQVRIFSSTSFDAASIDPSTVRFVIDGVLPGAPVGTSSTGVYMTAVSNLNGDGLQDRVLQFRVAGLKAAGLSGPSHQFVVKGQAAMGAFEATDPTQPAVVDYPPLTQVTIVPGSATIAVGGTVDLDAHLFSGSTPVSGRIVTWSSLDAAASVNSSGVMTGQSSGSARIVAAVTSEGKADTAEITVTSAGVAPSAVADSYGASAGTTLTVPDGATDLLSNDDLGSPASTLASFGGGSLGGAVTDNAAASIVSFGTGGSLQVNVDGSFTFSPSAGFTGSFTFQYRITNGSGSSDATVTIDVTAASVAPSAVADGYNTAAGTTLTVPHGATDLLANDNLGSSTATLVSFGGGSLGGAVTDRVAGDTVGFGSGGSLGVGANGSFSFTPAAGFVGSFTFQYRITNTAGSSDATVTITVTGTGPAAVTDAYDVAAGASLTVPDGATDLLANDNPGSPSATLVSFGGGSLGGAVTDYAAGSTTSFASGGSLTVGADGSFTFTPAAGFSGNFTFTYRITNAAGSSDATVTIDVQAPPTAVNEGPAAGSAPGQPFHAFFSTSDSQQTFSLTAPGVLSNDDLGFPAATITSFGADSLGGIVTTHAAGSTVSPLPGHASGSLSVGADGTITFTPPDGFTGNYVFRYRLTNSRGISDARVTIAVGARPAAASDTYSPVLVGNVPINTATSTQFRVTSNDAGDAKTLAITGQSNGTATLNADSTFTFRPNAGFEGAASFTYTVTNGFGTSAPATVSMTVANPVWFVNAGAAAGGDGRYDAPFNSLGTLAAINNGTGSNPAASDRIFLYTGSYTGPLTLLASQRLIGQGATAALSSVAGVAWPADAGAEPAMSGTGPTLTATNAVALTLANVGSATTANNTLRGFNIGSVGSAGTALAGTSFGTLAVSEVGIDTDGRALNLATGRLAGSFPQLRSTGGTNNVFLSTVATTGTATLGTGSDGLSGATGDALRIVGGTGSFTYPGSIANTSTLAVNITGKAGGTVTLSGPLNPAAAARGISVSGNTGGTISFTGSAQKISTGAAAGVSLSSNTGASINFAGGGLAIATTTGNGFNATGGGTVTVTGAANTISSAGGVALNVANTTIGAGGLVFRSISANGGTSGIVLNTTGSTAGLAVTGTGAAGTGGTIQNTTGDAVSLTGTVNPSLAFVAVQNNGGSGIRASTVSGLALSNALVDNNGDTSGGTEAGILLLNLSGTNQISASTIRNSFEDNVRWTPSSGAQTLTLTNTTVGPNNPTSGNSGVNIIGTGTASATLNVSGGTYTQNRSFGIGTSFTDNAAHAVNVSGATFTDNNMAIGLSTALNADVTFDIADNPGILRSRANAIQVLAGATSTSASQVRGSIRGNTIGDNTVDSGARDGVGIRIEINDDADAVIGVTGNAIRHTDQDGIFIQSRDPVTSDGDPATASVDLTVTGNTVGTPDDNAAFPFLNVYGIRVEGRHNTTTCLDLSGNTSSAVGVEHFQLRQRNSTSVFRLERYAGSGTDDAAVAGFVRTENAYAGVTAAATHESATGFTGVASGACRRP
jgi:hypothetical protein